MTIKLSKSDVVARWPERVSWKEHTMDMYLGDRITREQFTQWKEPRRRDKV